jgi:ribosome-associated protein
MFEKAWENEISMKAVRSSGPGGQNVNKVNSKVQLRFCIEEVSFLTLPMKERLYQKFPSRITTKGDFLMECSETRSQEENRQRVLQHLDELLQELRKVPKKRKASRPTLASRLRRQEVKVHLSTKKKQRRLSHQGRED